MTGSEWADLNRYIPLSTSPEPGQWRTSRTPYLREIMDAATDKITEKIVLMCSSQIGKSEALLNIMGYYADQEPSPQLMLQPTVEMAQAFSKERIQPMFRVSPGLEGKLVESKEGRGTEKKSSDTIQLKQFPGGFLALVGANSPAGLASRPIRVLLLDEVDRYPLEAGKEGPPIKLAVQRTRNFANRKIVMVSTPTNEDISAIYAEFRQGDQRKFMVTCPECGQKISFSWELVKWEKDKDGNALPDTAAMCCPECGTFIRGNGKINPDILATGVWEPTFPKNKTKSYHLNALYSPWVKLSDLVTEFTTATKSGDPAQLKAFVNLQLGEPWQDYKAESDFWEKLYDRRESYPIDSLPDGVLLLTAGVDVQHDRIEVTVYGWGLGTQCWAIRHRIIAGAPDTPAVWAQLDGLLATKFKVFGKDIEIVIAACCVDSGDGTYSREIYEYTKPRAASGVYAIKGRGGVGIPFIGAYSTANAAKAPLFTLGVDAGKTKLFGRLGIETPGPGYVHFDANDATGFNEEFFKQLTAETCVQVFEGGAVKTKWKKLRKRNEALDCAVYASAALEIINPDLNALAQYFAGDYAERKKEVKSKPTGQLSTGVDV